MSITKIRKPKVFQQPPLSENSPLPSKGTTPLWETKDARALTKSGKKSCILVILSRPFARGKKRPPYPRE